MLRFASFEAAPVEFQADGGQARTAGEEAGATGRRPGVGEREVGAAADVGHVQTVVLQHADHKCAHGVAVVGDRVVEVAAVAGRDHDPLAGVADVLDDEPGGAERTAGQVDPVTGVSVTFPDLDVTDELFKKNLIMPEPCPFLDRSLPICSIIRPTETEGIAMGVVTFLTNMGLFIGQSPAFFNLLTQLAQAADHARHGRG